MTTVEITRHYSQFINVADRYTVGNHEADGSAAMSTYALPAGYTVSHDAIYDDCGIECAVVPGQDGRPVLMSRMGRRPDVAMQEV